MKIKILICILIVLVSTTNVRAQWSVVDFSAKVDRIIERITTASSQLKNFTEYKAIADAARALKKVSSSIKNSKKVLDCFNLVTKHAELYTHIYKAAMQDKYYKIEEKVQIKANLIDYVKQSLEDFSDLKTAIIEGSAEMNDKERFDIVDLVKRRLTENYTKMYAFSRSIQTASKLRATSEYERNNKINLYGTKEKY